MAILQSHVANPTGGSKGGAWVPNSDGTWSETDQPPVLNGQPNPNYVPDQGSAVGALGANGLFGTGSGSLVGGYQGQPMQTAGGGGTSAAAQGQGTPGQQDAMAIIQGVLGQYGLGSLASWAWGLITSGMDTAAIQQQLYQRPEFQARFPAIQARQKAGLPPISPGDYVNYENQAIQAFNQYGLPQDFYSKEGGQALVDKLLSADVSIDETKARLQDYQQAVYQSNPAVIQQLQNLYGVTPGELTAFFIDPSTALPVIQKRFQSAQIAGQAQISGFGQLNQQQAETLYNQGVTQSQAQQGFEQLGLEQQLMNPLTGSQGTGISQNQQLSAQFLGDAGAARAIEMARQGRIAQFQGGGNFAANSKGTVGVGTELGSQA